MLASALVKHFLLEDKLPKENIQNLIMGCVLPAGLGQAPARQVALDGGLDVGTHAFCLNKVCGSGMASLVHAGLLLSDNPNQIILAGGMESMSRAPYLLDARFGFRFGHAKAVDHLMKDGLEDAGSQDPMGLFAEDLAKDMGFSREDQDAYAVSSAKKALEANAAGLLKTQQIEIPLKKGALTSDEPLGKVNLDKIPELRPAFKKDGTVTAGNASSLSDGASLLALTSASLASQKNVDVRAVLKGWASFSTQPKDFMVAPVHAAESLLKKLDWKAEEVDVWEVNEAFAVVPMAFQKHLDIPFEKINVWGGALALGHPLGASGARIVVNLLHIMESQNKKKGIAAICIGGGEGLAVALQRP